MTKDNRTIKTTNPYSGQSAMLNKEEFALYHIIKGAEIAEDYDTVRKGLHKFGKMNAAAYMILLDQLTTYEQPLALTRQGSRTKPKNQL